MPRLADVTLANQREGGGKFKFKEGKGRVIDSFITVEEIPNFTSAQCVWAFEIEPLDTHWQSYGATPIHESIFIGDVLHLNQQTGEPDFGWHPGKASNRDDFTSDYGQAGDLGDSETDPPIRGEVVLTRDGKSSFKDSAFSTLVNSMTDSGFKPTLMTKFFAPDFIGVEAEFTQKMAGRQSKSKGTEITSLIIGRGGKVVGAECVHKYPTGQMVGMTSATSGLVAVPQAGKTAGGPPPPPASAAQTGAAAPVGEDGTSADVFAVEILKSIGKTCAGQTLGRKKLRPRWTGLYQTFKVPPSMQAGVQDKVADTEWLTDNTEPMGWAVTGDAATGTVVIPAA